MEAYSVEDKGKGISFNVFVFNSQPGIKISYKDGKSKLLTDDTANYADENKIQRYITEQKSI